MGRRSGIKIYRDGKLKKGAEGSGLSLCFLQLLCTLLLVCAWWNAFLSVFPCGIGRAGLFLTLAAAAVCLQLLNYLGRKWTVLALGLFLAAVIFPGREFLVDFIVQTIVSVSATVSSGSAEAAGGAGLITDPLQMGVTAALAAVPVLEVWLLVLRTGRGRILAGLLIILPFIAAACGGFFPDALSSWLLLLAGGVYFACGTAGGTGQGRSMSYGQPNRARKKLPGRQAWTAAFMAFLVLAVTAVLASRMGMLLDVDRDVPGGYYQTARSFLTTELVGAVEEMIYGSREETPREQGLPETVAEDPVEEIPADQTQEETLPQESTEMPPQPDDESGIPGMDFSGGAPASGSSMDNLKDLEAYVPSEESMNFGVILDERPTETVYYPLRYGLEYQGDSWTEITEEDLQNSVTSFPWGMYLEDCRIWPDGLNQLRELCADWEGLPVEDTGAQIDRAFAELAVYDTRPGATPEDQDFVEYFLFENHRGFCVHFASAATLLYRMSGHTAVYVEGYAIPPSAFVEAGEDGRYSAIIDGTMGHAWCETFDEQTSSWTVREHTPAAPGTPEGNGGADRMDGDGPFWDGAGRILARAAAAAAVPVTLLAVLTCGTVLQAAVRRKRKRRRFLGKNCGAGIAAIYTSIIKTAERRGVRLKDPFSPGAAEALGEAFPSLESEEWEWICSCAEKNMFYFLEDAEADRKRMFDLYTRLVRDVYSESGFREKWLLKYFYVI